MKWGEPSRVAALVGAVCAGLVGGCGPDPRERAPEILYGEHECDHCRMILSDERTAAAAWTAQGAVRFDDLACLRAWWAETGGDVGQVWVHDFTTLEWLRASEAVFVRVPDRVTPMGSGWLALAGEGEAVALPGAVAAGPMGWSEFTTYTEGEVAERRPSL